jgi:hypothetical protein
MAVMGRGQSSRATPSLQSTAAGVDLKTLDRSGKGESFEDLLGASSSHRNASIQQTEGLNSNEEAVQPVVLPSHHAGI